MIDFSAFWETLVAGYAILFVVVVSVFGFVSHTAETRPQRQQRYSVAETTILQAVKAVRKSSID